MKIGPLSVTIHRTVRIADNRAPASLPPSLGRITPARVADFRGSCPPSWEDDAVFVPLHESEAIWLNFSSSRPVAIVAGAGGINALTGKPLGLKLETDAYMVAPPQPWLDGWKDTDGSVYQFVATAYKGGEGNTVGEQILGSESKSGGIGLAVFESKEPLQSTGHFEVVSKGFGGYLGGVGGQSVMRSCSTDRSLEMTEMGIGKGGKISQKIYADPHGIEVWKEEPTAVSAIYIVSAETYDAITGASTPKPVAQADYSGPYFEVKDEEAPDVAGSSAFTGLKTVFGA